MQSRKVLLAGLETAVAPASKKDGATTSPFADTFQQASADQAGRVSNVVAQRATSGDRAASGAKTSVAASSETGAGEAIKGVLALKPDGNVATPAVVSVESSSESAGKHAVSGAVGVDVAEDQIAASVGGHAEAGQADSPQFFVRSVSNSENKSEVPHLVEETEPSQGNEFTHVAAQGADGGNAAPKIDLALAKINSADDSKALGALSTIQQSGKEDLGVTGGAPRSAKASFASKIVSSRSDQNSPILASGSGASQPLSIVVGSSAQVASENLLVTSGKGLAPGSSATVGNEDSVEGFATVSRGITHVAVKKDDADLAADFEGPKVGIASGSLHPVGSLQILKSASGQSAGRVATQGLSDGMKGEEFDTGIASSTTSQDVRVIAVQVAGNDQPITIEKQQPTPQLQTDHTKDAPTQGPIAEVRGSSPVVLAGTISGVSRVLESGTAANRDTSNKAAGKTPSKHRESGFAKESVEVGSNVVTTPAVTEVAPASIAVTPVTSGLVANQFSASSKADLVSDAAQGRTFSKVATSSGSDHANHEANASTDGVTVAGTGRTDVAAKLESPGTSEPASSETLPAGIRENHLPADTASDLPLNHEAIVAAASSMVKNGQQREAVSAAASANKERKVVPGEAKASDALVSLLPAGSSVAHASTAFVAVKPVASEHQAVAVDGGQVAVSQVGSVAAASQSSLAAVVAPAPVVSPQHASSVVSTDVSMSAANATSQTSTPLGEHALSPMAHTTLSATPTVLEVGVPGGTQGWLKIRAEIGEGGVVQASVSASTHAGQEALHRDLPAISAFLESEHVPVNLQVAHGVSGSLVDAASATKDTGFNLGSSLGQSLNQNANSSTGSGQGEAAAGALGDGNSNGQRGSQQHEANGRTSGSESGAVTTRAAARAADPDWSAPVGYGSGATANGGGWLNVIA